MVNKTLKIINRKGKIMLKNKLLKIFGIALFVFLITLMGKVNAMPECNLNGETLTIINKEPGKLGYANTPTRSKFDHLVIKGIITYLEFGDIELIGRECKSIDPT